MNLTLSKIDKQEDLLSPDYYMVLDDKTILGIVKVLKLGKPTKIIFESTVCFSADSGLLHEMAVLLESLK